jgi:hypothetical protein
MSNFDDRNSTVRWMPRWARNILGLNADYEQPTYDRFSTDRQRMAEQGVGWVPGFVRSWLGLDFTEPKRYGPSSVYDPVAGQLVGGPGADPRRLAATQAAPPPRPAPEPMRAPSPPPPAAAPSYQPASTGGSSSSTAGLNFRREPSGGSAQSLPPGPPRNGDGSGSVTPGAQLSSTPQTEGYVQPVGYLLRSYARGALPPEGLEDFTKLSRKTIEDVWNFYSHWIRFQTDELGRIGKEAIDAVSDAVPGASSSQPAIRRIKVTTENGNGNGNGGKKPIAVAPAAAAPRPVVPPPAAEPPVVPPPAAEPPAVPPPAAEPPADKPDKK